MTTIRLGNAGNSVPGRAPGMRNSAAEFGANTADAIARLGAVGTSIALQQIDEQRREDEQLMETADRARSLTRLAEADAELRTAREQLAEEIRTGKVSADNDAAQKAWTERMTDIANRAGSELPKRTAPVGRAQVLSAGMRMLDDVRGVVRQKNVEDTRAGLSTFLELQERAALTDPMATARVVEALRNLGPSAGYGADDQQRIGQAFIERVSASRARALVRGAGDDLGQLDAAQAALGGEDFAGLTPEARGQVETLIENRRVRVLHAQEVARNRAQAAAEKRSRDAEDAAKSLQMLIDGGSLPADDFLSTVQARTAGTPYAETVKALVQQGSERAGFASLPPDRQQAALLQLRAQANAKGSTPELEKRINTLQSIASRSAEKIDREPLQWGADTRLLDGVQPIRFTTAADLVPQLAARVEQAAVVSSALKRPVSPLLSGEAQMLGDSLRVLPFEQQRGAVRMLAKALPPEQIRAMAKQMGDKDHALSLAMFASAQPSAGGADPVSLILQGSDADRAGRIKKDDAAAKADAMTMARELAKVPWPTTQARDAATQAAELVYKGLQDQKRGGSVSWREALRISNGELAEHAGQLVPVPPGWNERRFRNALKATDAVSLAGQMLGPVFVSGQEVRPEALAKALPAATLIPLGPGRYAIDAGGLVLNDQGKPWVFTLRD